MKDYLYDEVAKVAYDLHEKRGGIHGYDIDDWLDAERIVLERSAKGIAKKHSKIKAKKAK
ncbi:MAG: hypothetical protein A2Y97_09285 [Nitrospirae bacterium RBG_13_39_12]|nr:MAG: hypothetical protein A2Y97_09285 [Nitrospirae bacterium RBG_13_39_12]